MKDCTCLNLSNHSLLAAHYQLALPEAQHIAPEQVPRRFEMCEDPFGTGATPPPSATAAPLSTTEKAALAADNAAAVAAADAETATDLAADTAAAPRNGTAIALAALQAAAAEADAENKTAAADSAKASWLSCAPWPRLDTLLEPKVPGWHAVVGCYLDSCWSAS